MKFNIFYLILFILPLLLNCNDNDEDEFVPQIPECIQQKIIDISAQEVWNPPAKIYQYMYKGDTVFFIPQRCCDIFSELYDKNCNLICAPDGGVAGEGDGVCPDFFEERSNEMLIWEDQREAP